MCNGDNPQVQKSTNYRDVPNLFAARNAKMPAPNLKVNSDTARPRKIWRIEWSWNGDDAENRVLMFMAWLLYYSRDEEENYHRTRSANECAGWYYYGRRREPMLGVGLLKRRREAGGRLLATLERGTGKRYAAWWSAWRATKKRVKGKRGKSSIWRRRRSRDLVELMAWCSLMKHSTETSWVLKKEEANSSF